MCRDIWIFSYLCNGINMADLCRLRYSNISDGKISYNRQKTIRTDTDKTKIVAIMLPEMQRIIDQWVNKRVKADTYIFPFLNDEWPEDLKRLRVKTTTRLINKKMNEIGEALKLGSISTYTARHSFATVLRDPEPILPSLANPLAIAASKSLRHTWIHLKMMHCVRTPRNCLISEIMNILQTSFMERFEKSLDKEAILSREIEAHEMLFDEALLPLPPDIHSTKRPIRELSYTDGAILQIREAYIKFIVNGTDIAEAGDLYSVNGEMKRRPPSDIQIHYYNEARERHSHLQWLKGLTKHELIISDMVIIAIFNKYKHHFGMKLRRVG